MWWAIQVGLENVGDPSQDLDANAKGDLKPRLGDVEEIKGEATMFIIEDLNSDVVNIILEIEEVQVAQIGINDDSKVEVGEERLMLSQRWSFQCHSCWR